MNGWNTIKKVRTELSEAMYYAKHGNKTLANLCLTHAELLLKEYCAKAQNPEYGFEPEILGS